MMHLIIIKSEKRYATGSSGSGRILPQIFPVNKNYVTNYMFPYQVSGDSLLYLKTSYRHRPAFYIKDAKVNTIAGKRYFH